MSEYISHEQISARVWLEVFLPMLQEGYTLKLSPKGWSMYPFLVGGRDYVVLEHCTANALKRGDIILYRRPNGKMVLHRIYRRDNGSYQLLGDRQKEIEYGVLPEQICAKARSIVRKGRCVSCRGTGYRILSELWLRLRVLRPLLFKLKRLLWKG